MKPIEIIVFVLAVACESRQPADRGPTRTADRSPVASSETAPTAREAETFMDELEAELLRLWTAHSRAKWVKRTYITHDTNILAARAREAVMEFVGRKVEESKRFDGLELNETLARKFKLLKLSLSLPAPSDEAERKELAQIASDMESMYGKGKYCSGDAEDKCRNLGELSEILAGSRDYDELKDAWQGWRTISIPMRDKYIRFVELANKGARDMGFDDVGAVWKSRYDMPPDAFEAELGRLWNQVKPLYDQIHCYVRARLHEKYGEDKAPAKGPIPAHLLGNMWSQTWNNVFDLVRPSKGASFDLTKILKAKKIDEKGMVKQAESFFVSLGFDPLPKTFWERSMFVKPRDRDVVCHASAWDVDQKDDLRIKMCIKVDAEDFTTVHHELGHNYYYLVYKNQPPLFTSGANDGFHEAIGDTLALSVTPSYLVKTGYIDKEPPDSLNPLMLMALDKIAFLPFGFVIDKWRFDVFSGKVKPDSYNAHWWKLRTKYQGITPPVERTEEHFDPGAKYHIAGNTPYTRYFLASILQFQFHRALCKEIGYEGPLHKCSIYGNKEAGKRLYDMMEMGQQRPWPEALKALTGEEKMDASAIIDYFKPLIDWLEEQNKEATCGW
ncbi:MAG: M2 family metallopeptidase [Proteobacteria bacterium]|nr:M2 family metallopeptidase [Pseudomonadota bacterium]